jgi:Ca2+-transporting ATPase
LLDQFRSLVVMLLLAATVIALVMGDVLEAAAILVVILLNALIGFVTELRANQALRVLERQLIPTAMVRRGGADREIAAAELVPGDLVLLDAGRRVPADGRVIEAQRLLVDESALTGESVPVGKVTEAISDREASIGDRKNLAYLGTTVLAGRGRMLVTATGSRTELGRIGRMLSAATERQTPLERKLDELSGRLVWIVLGICGVIVVIGHLRGVGLLEMMKIGISLAIAAVPEGLPAVATMTLAIGMQRMARSRALIRRLPAVETLGATTVICTDKTGTLTRNEMSVEVIVLGDGRRIQIRRDTSGSGFWEGETEIDPSRDAGLMLALRVGVMCNDAVIEKRGEGHVTHGDPTEAALLWVGRRAGLERAELEKEEPRWREAPFDPRLKRMMTVHRKPGGVDRVYVKGSPRAVLEGCDRVWTAAGLVPLEEGERTRILESSERLAERALRMIGLAYREGVGAGLDLERWSGGVYVGMMGMMDPVRAEVPEAIERCRRAGIRVIMMTGDHPMTGKEIARQLGLERGLDGEMRRVVHARTLEGLDRAGWEEQAMGASVFARVAPEHKLMLVEALQRRGEIVAMTGDGVNDAPALRQADIGVAMGRSGTEVAKEAADMVLTDDHFATLVGAVEQGRILYQNIKRFVHYLISCNLSEILVVFLAIVAGWPAPLVALQILWLNLVTDVFPALALALEPTGRDVMDRPPRPPREPMLSVREVWRLGWMGLLLALSALVVFGVGLSERGEDGGDFGVARARTMAFMTLSLGQVFHAFDMRSLRESLFARGMFKNGWLWFAVAACVLLQVSTVFVAGLRRILQTVELEMREWLIVLLGSVATVVIVELTKLWTRARARSEREGS